MRQTKTLIAAICLAATLSLYGQGEFKPGYIINLEQDTIYGQIKSNSEARNARICIFRTGEDAESSQFSPGQISAYRISGGKYYVSETVEDEGEQTPLFLEYLVDGKADLYYLRKDNSEVYYIRKEGEEALALTDIRLLKAAFSDCYEIQSSLDRAALNHKSLVNMTVKYHDCVSEGALCINYSRETSGLRIQVGPVLGYSVNSLRIVGDPMFDLVNSELCWAPVFGLLLDLGTSRLGDHLSFQLGAGLSRYSSEGYDERRTFGNDFYTYEALLEAPVLSFQLGTSYAFSGNRVRPSLGGGLEVAKFIAAEFSYTETAYLDNWDGPVVSSDTFLANPVENLLFGAYLKAGLDVKLSKKLVLTSAVKAGFLTSNPNTIITTGTGIPDQMRLRPEMIPVSIQIGILF